ncbi:MAG TPA: hypothetical protein VEI02_04080 [Planctomycetota bacterium]|nr:hypothetical protein [Planctomycetota bacterium]
MRRCTGLFAEAFRTVDARFAAYVTFVLLGGVGAGAMIAMRRSTPVPPAPVEPGVVDVRPGESRASAAPVVRYGGDAVGAFERPLQVEEDPDVDAAPAAPPDDGASWFVPLPDAWRPTDGADYEVELRIGLAMPEDFCSTTRRPGEENASWHAVTARTRDGRLAVDPPLRRRVRDACERPCLGELRLASIVSVKPVGALVRSSVALPASLRAPAGVVSCARLRDVELTVTGPPAGAPTAVELRGADAIGFRSGVFAWDPGPHLVAEVDVGAPVYLRVEEGLELEARTLDEATWRPAPIDATDHLRIAVPDAPSSVTVQGDLDGFPEAIGVSTILLESARAFDDERTFKRRVAVRPDGAFVVRLPEDRTELTAHGLRCSPGDALPTVRVDVTSRNGRLRATLRHPWPYRIDLPRPAVVTSDYLLLTCIGLGRSPSTGLIEGIGMVRGNTVRCALSTDERWSFGFAARCGFVLEDYGWFSDLNEPGIVKYGRRPVRAVVGRMRDLAEAHAAVLEYRFLDDHGFAEDPTRDPDLGPPGDDVFPAHETVCDADGVFEFRGVPKGRGLISVRPRATLPDAARAAVRPRRVIVVTSAGDATVEL